MELTATSREVNKKSDVKNLRRQGGIPAILYSNGVKGKEIAVMDAEFQKLLRSIPKGTLSSKVITLHLEGKSVKVIVKGIEYRPTTYQVIHLDFQALHDDVEVNVKIPLVCVGVADCAGIKLGGFLRQVMYAIPVRVKPKSIPNQFELDIRAMSIGESKALADITMGKDVHPLVAAKEIVAVISKR